VESSPDTPGDPSRRSVPRAGPGAAATELDLLNINEIATALRVSRMTVYRLIREGRLPAFRVGKSFRVHRRDLASYLDTARQAPPYGESSGEPGGPAPDQ